MMPQRVAQILRSIQQLRPMPTTVTRTLRALEDPECTAGYVSDLISLDQALAAMVLQMANSVAMGYRLNCTSLSDAVMRLGFKRLKTLVLGAASSGPLMRRLNGYRLGAGDLWNHSVATAVASQWLAQALHYPNPEEAYVGGLLHDIGKLMLDQYVLVDYTKIVDLMRRYNLSLWQVEEQVIGIDHATVGSMMAEKWNYPVILVDAIHYHHAPSLARVHPELPAIINVANAWSSRQSPASQEIFVQSIHPESLQILRLSEERLERFQEEMTAYMIGS